MIRSLHNSSRLIVIAATLTRYNALFLQYGKRPGLRLARALEKLGPAFIKLGQVASTRSDLIGEEMAEDLSCLRDALPPFSSVIARKTVEDELHAPIASLFKEFDDAPVAAASIAQVHRAVTKAGKKVAVKILRPYIEDAFARDIDLFFWLAEMLEHRPAFRRMRPMEVVRTLKETVFFELDLRLEAAAAAELAANVEKHDTGFRVPAIDWNLTSRRVLTMEWVDGIPLADVAAIRAAGFSPDEILAKAATSLFTQVFEDGFFHADLHPGNLFVDKNGDLVAVDFGIMGRLDWKSRMYMAEILRGFLTEDYEHVAAMHFAAGYVPNEKSMEAFTQACRGVAKPITGKPLNEISVAKLLGQMFRIAAEFEMETQPQLLLLQKTMMVTEGVGRMLNPNLNMWNLARPMVESWAEENFGATARLKVAAGQGRDVVRKFPAMLGYVENALKTLGDPRGVKLHPATVYKLNANKNKQQRKWFMFAWVALVVTLLCAFLLAR
jgi:ubiquinone biosynthesis protein